MAQDCITFKGTRGGLLILLDASRDFNELRANLAAKFAAARGFFKGASFALVPTSPLSSHETAELEAICREYGLVPGNNITLPARYRSSKKYGNATSSAVLKNNFDDAMPAPALAETTGLPTLLEEVNLRNGRELIYNGHVVLVGNVHQGATIKASGNILVMGTLLGSAHAGVADNRKAVIVAYRMTPEQLSIAGVIARSPEQNTRRPYPEIARLAGNKIIVEPYLNLSRKTS
ncbi:septum site-determining protein MinC [Moorella sulfitireducens (nom. illeg.)]|uniref:septum site-determining protein MinC n=1 Tax=Neomoorella sulfitireducens TaxID=2972948 RepID=UPI0021ACF0BE|nr:septum site-determining protein MinC [Moorella sulfitireducens]